MIKIVETLKEYSHKPNTVNGWLLEKEEKREVDEELYNSIVSEGTMKWFRRIGGSETAKRTYTPLGYKVYKLTSKSPDREIKKVRQYEFITI